MCKKNKCIKNKCLKTNVKKRVLISQFRQFITLKFL